MIINYRYADSFTEIQQIQLANFGLKVKQGFNALIIDSNHPNFNEVKDMFDDWEEETLKTIKYSKLDFEKAESYEINAEKYLGYAKPDVEEIIDTYKYPFDIYPQYKDVYEVKATGKYGMLRGKQIGSFKISGEPKWGKNHLASLFGATDCFFTTPEVYNDIFKPLNILSMPVIDFKSGKTLKTIVQILPQGVSQNKLNIKRENINKTIKIDEWNLTKYVLRGDVPFPDLEKSDKRYDFYESQEYFGDGGLNLKSIIISKKLYNLIVENKLKGLNIIPMLAPPRWRQSMTGDHINNTQT